MNYVNFESILVPKSNGKQNPDESYLTNVKIMCLVAMVTNISTCGWSI